MIKRCLKESETCFLDTLGHLDWDSFNKRAAPCRKEIGIGEGERRSRDELNREAKSKMSRRAREKDDDVAVVWKAEASPEAGTCSKGY